MDERIELAEGAGSALAEAPAEQLCIDFVNTVGDHASDHPEERLHTYDDLARWAQRVGLATEREGQTLSQVARERPDEARQALERAITLREAIYRIFVALIAGQPVSTGDLATLNAMLSDALRGPQVAMKGASFAWAWPLDHAALEWPARAAALSAAELLTSEARERVGQCASEDGCGWLFLDTSRNRSRRWCSMGDCGNRAKQRRHARRHAASRATTAAD
jgi:predicted RNA-binding Zn ribbon-like protein